MSARTAGGQPADFIEPPYPNRTAEAVALLDRALAIVAELRERGDSPSLQAAQEAIGKGRAELATEAPSS